MAYFYILAFFKLQIIGLKVSLEKRQMNGIIQEEYFLRKEWKQNCNLAKEILILRCLKGAHIPGWPEDRQSVAAQIIVTKKKERRLRKDKLIWTVCEIYFVLFKYVDGFMF